MRVACEHIIVVLNQCFVACKAGFVLCLVDRFPIYKAPKSPTVGVRVFFGIFHHDLHGGCFSGNSRRLKLRGRFLFPGEFHQNSSIRKGKISLFVSSNRFAIPHHCSQFV